MRVFHARVIHTRIRWETFADYQGTSAPKILAFLGINESISTWKKRLNKKFLIPQTNKRLEVYNRKPNVFTSNGFQRAVIEMIIPSFFLVVKLPSILLSK
ncbi:MAG: hypothetical protein ACTSRA_13920, partial [Promethearchaeota archaeon]